MCRIRVRGGAGGACCCNGEGLGGRLVVTGRKAGEQRFGTGGLDGQCRRDVKREVAGRGAEGSEGRHA